MSPMWNGWLASGSVLLAGPGSKWPAGRREVRLALADRVQVHAVQSGLQAARRHGDVDDDAGALLALDELDLAGDAVAFDIGLRARAALCHRHRARQRQRRSRQHHSSIHHHLHVS